MEISACTFFLFFLCHPDILINVFCYHICIDILCYRSTMYIFIFNESNKI